MFVLEYVNWAFLQCRLKKDKVVRTHQQAPKYTQGGLRGNFFFYNNYESGYTPVSLFLLSLTKETFLAEVEVLFNVHVPVPGLVLVVEDQFAPVAEGQGDSAHLGTPGQHSKEKKCLLIKRRERD